MKCIYSLKFKGTYKFTSCWQLCLKTDDARNMVDDNTHKRDGGRSRGENNSVATEHNEWRLPVSIAECVQCVFTTVEPGGYHGNLQNTWWNKDNQT